MNVQVPIVVKSVSVKLTKCSIHCRYDIPTYESGGLCWVDLSAPKSLSDDSYLVEVVGCVIGVVTNEGGGKWSGMKASTPATCLLNQKTGNGVAFVSCVQGEFKTRNEVLAKLVATEEVK